MHLCANQLNVLYVFTIGLVLMVSSTAASFVSYTGEPIQCHGRQLAQWMAT
jgi:hypothetical protein